MQLQDICTLVIAFIQSHLISIFIACSLLYLLGNRYGHGISHIPGPAIASVTGFWRVWDVHRGHAHRTNIELHQRYGHLVRIGPNHISVGDPKALPIIYGSKPVFTKTPFASIQSISLQKKPQTNLFSTIDETYHRDQKKAVGAAYSMNSLLEMEDAVDSCSTLFMSKLSDYASSSSSLDLGAWLQYYAFDVVGSLTFNKRFGFLEQGKDVGGMMATIQGMLVYTSLIGQVPYLHSILLGNPLLRVLLPSMEHWDKVLQFTLETIKSRATLSYDGGLKAERGEVRKDQLTKWNKVKDADETKLSTREIIAHTSVNVFAGSDTTAIVLRSIIYSLLCDPARMDRLMAEIDGADEAGNLSHPIRYKEAKTHLPYLQAVVKEALRIHPPGGFPVERYVPGCGMEICGQQIPAGTIVGINPWVVHHDAAVFPNPGSFMPERWIDSSKDKVTEMEASSFAFGAGTRACIGKNFSLMEIHKIVPQLLREYKIELAHPEKEWEVRNVWFV